MSARKGIARIYTLAISFLFFVVPAFAYVSPGTPTGYVNDFAGILAAETTRSLEEKLKSFEEKTSHEISVVTVPSLGGDSIEDYANALFREWGIGKEGINNGVLFLVAVQDRKMRIEVGYGLEGALTDLETQVIEQENAVPFFKQGDYSGGIALASEKIMEAIESEIAPSQKGRTPLQLPVSAIEGIILFVIFVFSWFASVLARTKSWWLGGVVGGIFGAAIGMFTATWIWTIVAAVLGLIFDYVVSKNYRSHPQHPAWWAGGTWHGWDRWSGGPRGGSWGGGFGGFGGGSSGGGGSSSSW